MSGSREARRIADARPDRYDDGRIYYQGHVERAATIPALSGVEFPAWESLSRERRHSWHVSAVRRNENS